MLYEEADRLLNDEVSTGQILKFLSIKYETEDIVTSRTIQRWIKELNIECIKPKPSRPKDIRYRKRDVLRLEETFRVNLLRKKHNNDVSSWGKDIVDSMEELKHNFGEYYLQNTSDTESEEESLEFGITNEVKETIYKDMIEMCFKKMFPGVYFDENRLYEILYKRSHYEAFTEDEIVKAIIDYDNKNYIRGYKKSSE